MRRSNGAGLGDGSGAGGCAGGLAGLACGGGGDGASSAGVSVRAAEDASFASGGVGEAPRGGRSGDAGAHDSPTNAGSSMRMVASASSSSNSASLSDPALRPSMLTTFPHFLHFRRWTRSAKRCCQSLSGKSKRPLHDGQSTETGTGQTASSQANGSGHGPVRIHDRSTVRELDVVARSRGELLEVRDGPSTQPAGPHCEWFQNCARRVTSGENCS